MSDSFRIYQVVETEGMTEEELQRILAKATNIFPEQQIDYVVGTKIILGHESLLNERGRAEAQIKNTLNTSESITASSDMRV